MSGPPARPSVGVGGPDSPGPGIPSAGSLGTDLPGARESAGRLGGLAWTALGLVYVVWGSTYLAIRIADRTMPPFLSAAARFLAAGLLLAGAIGWRSMRAGGTRHPGPREPSPLSIIRRQLASVVLVGLLLLVGGNGLVVLAETVIPSGLAALLVAAVPLWVVVLRAGFGDRPRGATVVGVLLGFAGLIVLTVPGIAGSVKLSGVVAVIAASVLWSTGSFASSRLPMPVNPFVASAYEMLAGGIGDLLIGLGRGEQHRVHLASISTGSWLALAYLVVFGSIVAFTAYAWLLQNAPLSLVSTYAYVNPVVAVALGWLILAEPVSWPIALGGAIVVAGVGVVVSNERRRGPAQPLTEEVP
ncbi:drug/metabolite transporter (DMT)-like permease [Streptomyces sp. 846.5]|nr:EamA family transporter [Streptomyces sp. 846.5]TDT97451.1 drug/metabolite transporter (DMT)-like permease [Streptomyces sp. 846.5]